MKVSVPLRGITFLNQKCMEFFVTKSRLFPSPYGELHFSIKGGMNMITMQTMFPSPYGELHFSISQSYYINAAICFRPLTGNYISQC